MDFTLYSDYPGMDCAFTRNESRPGIPVYATRKRVVTDYTLIDKKVTVELLYRQCYLYSIGI